MAYVIAEPCVDVHDCSCVDECPVDCIYDGLRKGYTHPDECIDCGACEPVCPVAAIFRQEDLPAEWKHYAGIEREFFGTGVTGLGSPGGAVQVGQTDADHPALGSISAA
ncbi:MAG: ferredoxin family protein [Actinobacteria bacterium]|nr:ferredoxin family protein [Actinomycetota bacterium]